MLTFDSNKVTDYRILYDARQGWGYKVNVYDSIGKVVDSYQTQDDKPARWKLMLRARKMAIGISRELDGTVYVGFDPTLLSGDIFG